MRLARDSAGDMANGSTRLLAIFVACLMSASACGSGEPSLSEYAAGAEALVAKMRADFAVIDSEWESEEPTKERALRYWEARLAIRAEFLEGVQSLQPPAEVADQHAAALDVFTRMKEADQALAARVADLTDVTTHRGWLDTSEGRASLAVLDEVYEFCRASQAEYDATAQRERLHDLAFLPPEMKQIVSVAFGCPPPDQP